MYRRGPGEPETMFGRSAGDDHLAARAERRRSSAKNPQITSGTSSSVSSSHGDLKPKMKNGHQRSLLRGTPPARGASRPRSTAPRGGTPAAASMRTRPLRSSAAAAAKRSRRFRSLVSTRSCLPVSGSTSRSSPTSASSCSRGSRISTAIVGCRPATRSSGVPPVDRPAEVRDDDDERALDREAVEQHQRIGEPAPPRRLRRAARRASAGARAGPGAAGASADPRRRR